MIFVDKKQMSQTIIWIVEIIFLLTYLPLATLIYRSQITEVMLFVLLGFFIFQLLNYFIACFLYYQASNAILKNNGISNNRYYTEHFVKRWQTLEQFKRNLAKNTTNIAVNQYFKCKHMNHVNQSSYAKPHSKMIDLIFYTMPYEEYVRISNKQDGYHILINDYQSPLSVMQSDSSINGIIYEEQGTIKASLEIKLANLFHANKVSASFQWLQKILRLNPFVLLYGDIDFISYFLENVANDMVVFK